MRRSLHITDLPREVLQVIMEYAYLQKCTLHMYTERVRAAGGASAYQLYTHVLKDPSVPPPEYDTGVQLDGFSKAFRVSCAGFAHDGHVHLRKPWPLHLDQSRSPAFPCDWSYDDKHPTSPAEHTAMLLENNIEPAPDGSEWPHKLSLQGKTSAGGPFRSQVCTPLSMTCKALPHAGFQYHTRMPLLQSRTIMPYLDCTEVYYTLLFAFVPEPAA